VPHLGPRPVYTVNEIQTGKMSTAALSDKSTYKDAIEEAEEALKALRLLDQEKERDT
jgi:hypothetical protein